MKLFGAALTAILLLILVAGFLFPQFALEIIGGLVPQSPTTANRVKSQLGGRPIFQGPVGEPRVAGPANSPPSAEPLQVGEIRTLTGTVMRNITEMAKLDGPAYLEIATSKSGIVRVEYSAGESSKCPGVTDAVWNIAPGSTIEARGQAYLVSAINACLDGGYVKLLSP